MSQPAVANPTAAARGGAAAALSTCVFANPEAYGDFAALDADRSSWLRGFSDRILADERVRGRMLDVGCAKVPHELLKRIFERATQVDGVDPQERMRLNPTLTEKWVGLIEEIDEIPEAAYDAVFAFFVAEHLDDPKPFLRAVHRAMKPGAVFYATTPNGKHPFPIAVRMVEALGLKDRLASQAENINDYPAYYRMNTPAQVTRIVQGLADEGTVFDEIEFMFYPCVQWDTFVPRRLRFIAHTYDRMWGIHRPERAQMMMFRLHKPEGVPSGSAA